MVKRVAKLKKILLQNCPVYQIKPEIVTYCLPSKSCSKFFFPVGVFGIFKTLPTVSSGNLCCNLYFLRSHTMYIWNIRNHKRLQLQRNILCNKYPTYYSLYLSIPETPCTLSVKTGPKTACRSHLILVEHNNSVTVVHKGSWQLCCSFKFLRIFLNKWLSCLHLQLSSQIEF